MLYRNRETGEIVDALRYMGDGPDKQMVAYTRECSGALNTHSLAKFHQVYERIEEIPRMTPFEMRDSNVRVVPETRHSWDVTLEAHMKMTIMSAGDCTKIIISKDDA